MHSRVNKKDNQGAYPADPDFASDMPADSPLESTGAFQRAHYAGAAACRGAPL